MKITGWTAPDDGRPWYPVAQFQRVNVAVEALGAALITVKLAQHPSHNRLMWWDLLASGDWAPLVPWRHPGLGPSLDGRYPVCWRPLAGIDWPHPLPSPVAGPLAAPVVIEPPEPPPHPETDGWPYPDVRLGCRVPPVSIEECEARVLRGLRKMNIMARVGHAARSIAADWPAEWYYLMRRIEDVERSDGHIGDVRVAWTPTRRDNTDWDYALDWWRHLDPEVRELVALRAANPVFSWRGCAERLRLGNKETCRAAYARAIDVMYRIALTVPAENVSSKQPAGAVA